MANVDRDRFIQLLTQSELVDEDRLRAHLDQVRQAAGGELPAEASELAERLIELDVLTSWQCSSLLNGKYKGFILGKYKLLRHLGSGGMSSVYLAEHKMMGHRVAIKVLPRSKVEDSSYLARFQREAQAAARLKHRNIVQAYDIDNQGSTHYIVMEFVAGANLQALVKEDGPLDYETAADYVAQAAEGLQHAHDAGLVHRDIKPANLLVDEHNTVKVLDMGLAMFFDDDKPSLTVAHDENVLGTADYLAPEQAINSHKVDYRADIYSLGCTLYYLLTGHPPFPEGTLPQRLMKHQTQMPPSIYEDRADAPQVLVNICLRMMQKAPGARYQQASDIVQELTAWLVSPNRPSSPARVSSGGAAPLPSAPPKELRTRDRDSGGGRRPRTRPAPPDSSDTRAESDSNTVKGGGRRPRARARDSGPGSLDEIRIRTDDSDRRRGISVPASNSDQDNSGEFVFDARQFGEPTGSGSNKRSILSERADLQRRSSDTPWWLWAMLGAGVLVVLGLLYLIMSS